MATTDPYEDTVVPRAAVSFPLRVPVPEGFDPERLDTWPSVTGRLEYANGALWFMPPSGDDQQDTTADVVTEIGTWARTRDDFVVGTNEAGMKLGSEVRAADVAVWRASDLGQRTGGIRRVPPVLAVEVAGVDDTVASLRDKAKWYLDHGVEIVWILDTDSRTAVILTKTTNAKHELEDRIPEQPSLPDLRPYVANLFRQVTRKR